MIANPKPGTDRYRLLALIVAYPGELGTTELAAHLWPPPKLPPPTNIADVVARQKARDQAEKMAQAKVSAMLRQLSTKGLIMPCGAPVLSEWFGRRLERFGAGEALRRACPSWPGKCGPLEAHILMVRRIIDRPPVTVADLLGKAPSGATKQTYRDLCAWGVVIPPSFRYPTQAGIALVGGA